PPHVEQSFCKEDNASCANVRSQQCLMAGGECAEGGSSKNAVAMAAAAAVAMTVGAARPSSDQRGLKRKSPDHDDIKVEPSGEGHCSSCSGLSDPRSSSGGSGRRLSAENGGAPLGEAAALPPAPSPALLATCANYTGADAGDDGSAINVSKGAVTTSGGRMDIGTRSATPGD
ncbi:hypothetical protein Vretifemale_921, partial [Volvox reticuliferus]